MTTQTALIVDDEPDIRDLLEITLTRMGITTYTAPDLASARELLQQHNPQLCLTDMNLPDGTGLDVLTSQLQYRADLPIVVVTAESILDNALSAIRQGAYDYIVKTGDYLFAIPVIVEKNLAMWRTKQENARLQNRLQSTLSSIQNSTENLSAAESRIRDVDVAWETADLTRNTILQQAATSVLAQANLQPQLALSLLS